MKLPFAHAADENKQVIFDAVGAWLRGHVLEIGSGTGQHAVYFAARQPVLTWQTSDLASNLSVIQAWIDDSGLDNLPPPIELDVNSRWPETQYDTIYTANSFHIMDAEAVARCMDQCGQCLHAGGHLIVYGPFNYDGEYTSPSNARFDAMLRANDPGSGIRDFEWLDQLASRAAMTLQADIAMPANNRSLIWKKRT